MSFDEDLALAQKATRYQDEIYNMLFSVKSLKRFQKEEESILDIRFHIDLQLELTNGIKLLGQEKALRFQFSQYNTFTMEFYQDRFSREEGEFFNLGAQFYLHSYWNKTEDGFCKWYLVNLFNLFWWLKDRPREALERITKPSTSKASFLYFNYEELPIECVMAKKRSQ